MDELTMNTLVHYFNQGYDFVRLMIDGRYVPGERLGATHKLKCTDWNTKAKQEPRRLWRPLGYATAVLAVKIGARRRKGSSKPIIVNEPLHDEPKQRKAPKLKKRVVKARTDLGKAYEFTAARMDGTASTAPLKRKAKFHKFKPVPTET